MFAGRVGVWLRAGTLRLVTVACTITTTAAAATTTINYGRSQN